MQACIARRCVVVVMLASAAFAGRAHALHDHLKCYKMLDPLRLRGVVDIDAAPVATPLPDSASVARAAPRRTRS